VTTDPAPTLYFDTDPAWLDPIRQWAAKVPEVEQVWIFGSSATGVRRPKEDPPSLPDLDIAYTLRGAARGDLLALARLYGEHWRGWLQRRIAVPIHLELTTKDDEKVWPAVQAHGI